MSVNTHLHNHMVGFPHYERKEEELQTEIQISREESRNYNCSSYLPLYEMSNSYLSNGYSVLYSAESVPNESAKEKLFENIANVNPTQVVQNNLASGFLMVVNRDSNLIYKLDH